MKYTFFLVLIFTFSFTNISAQQDHFLYFQTEANQAFYIKLGDKIFNSSPSGYLILSKLKGGDYTLIFGFPKNEWPEEIVNYTLEKDAGFLLKNFPDKGWGLYDLQSLSAIMPVEKQTNKIIGNEEMKKDNFSEMLAAVVNDSTIKQKDIVVKDDKKDAPVQVLYSLITKNLQVKNKGGMEMIYTDEYNNDKDTIRIFIPVEKDKEKNENPQAEAGKITSPADTGKNIQEQLMVNQSAVKEQKNENQPLEAVKINSPADTSKNMQEQVVVIPSPDKEQKKDTSVTIADTSKNIAKEDKVEFLPPKTGMINSNCRQYAKEDDFLKLRKKMAAESNDDDMIITAKKIFKAKCFTTKDIKNLSTLFLNDRGKYSFFDTAYPYVSDSDAFYTLENQLSDEYYIKRFKAMILH